MSVRVMLWALKLKAPVSHACARVLMVLAERAKDDGTDIYPSLDTISSTAQTDRKTVVRCLDKLEADGIITRQTGGGRNNSTSYVINLSAGDALETVAPCPTAPSETVATGHGSEPGNSGAMTINSGPEPINSGVEPPNTVLNQEKKERGSLRSLRVRAEPTPFDAWWEAYPRKVGRDAAAKAYASAVKRGASHADLASGLQRQEWPDEARFIPHAATWLNQGRWKDDPTHAAPRATGPPSKHGWMAREFGLSQSDDDDFHGATLEPELQH